MLDFRIDTFLKVVELMNFTKAAEELHITQPAVSGHIRYLEKLYGIKLFAYDGKKMFLTLEGEYLYNKAITMKNDEKQLKSNLLELSVKGKKLVFGTTLTIGEFVMTEPIKVYLTSYPKAKIKMLIGNTSELLDKLALGEIDFAIVEGNFEKEKYDYSIFSQEKYIPVCGKNYKFTSEPKILKDLLNERLIIREEGSGTREILEKNLQARNISVLEFNQLMEIGGMNAIKKLIEANMGITFLYEVAVEEELKKGTIREIELEDFHVTHEFAFIWNKDSVFATEYVEIFKMMSKIQ